LIISVFLFFYIAQPKKLPTYPTAGVALSTISCHKSRRDANSELLKFTRQLSLTAMPSAQRDRLHLVTGNVNDLIASLTSAISYYINHAPQHRHINVIAYTHCVVDDHEYIVNKSNYTQHSLPNHPFAQSSLNSQRTKSNYDVVYWACILFFFFTKFVLIQIISLHTTRLLVTFPQIWHSSGHATLRSIAAHLLNHQ